MSAYASERLTAEHRDDVLIVRFNVKELRGDELVESIREELQDLVRKHEVDKVVLDFSTVTFASSRAMGGLAAFNRDFRQSRGGKVALCCFDEMVAESFAATRLISSKGFRPVAGVAAATSSAESAAPVKPLFEHVTEDVPSAIEALQRAAVSQGNAAANE